MTEERSFMEPILINGDLEELAKILGGKVEKIRIPLFKMDDFGPSNVMHINADDEHKFRWSVNQQPFHQ